MSWEGPVQQQEPSWQNHHIPEVWNTKAYHERYWYRWKCLSPCSLAEKQTNYIAPSVFSLYRAKANGWRHWFLLIYSEPVKRRRLKQTMLRSLIMYDDKSNFRFVILTICVRSKLRACDVSCCVWAVKNISKLRNRSNGMESTSVNVFISWRPHATIEHKET